MELLKNATEVAARAVETAREADRVKLATAARNAGGPIRWLRQHAPRVADGCPEDLTEPELVAETAVLYVEADGRLGLCQQCPDTGGACDGDPSALGPGELPVWRDRRLVKRPCARWREHVLRKRLQAAGVPAASASATFGTYPGSDQAVDACTTFYESALRRQHAWLVLQGPHQSGKTHLAVATMRGFKKNMPRMRLCYLNVSRVEAALKAFFDSPRELPDPLADFVRAEVSVLDNFNTTKMPQWLQTRVADALLQRWEEQRCTILTTRESNMKPVYGALTELSGLASMPRQKLRRELEGGQ